MNIAIIGAGNVGMALAGAWKKAGHSVIFGARDASPSAARGGEDIPRLPVNEAISAASVVVLTLPAEAVPGLLPLPEGTPEKVIIDCTNAYRNKPDGYPTAFHFLQAKTNCRQLAKCFNSTGFENMANPDYGSTGAGETTRLDMFMAGDSEAARQACQALSADAGFANCYDFGGSDKVELLEQFALSWINLAIMQKMGRNIAFKLVRRH